MLYLPFLRRFVEIGTLTVIDPQGGKHRLEGAGGPSAAVRLHDSSVSRAMFRDPALAVGEAYMDGRLTVEDGTLFDFLTIALVNQRRARLKSDSRFSGLRAEGGGPFAHAQSGWGGAAQGFAPLRFEAGTVRPVPGRRPSI